MGGGRRNQTPAVPPRVLRARGHPVGVRQDQGE